MPGLGFLEFDVVLGECRAGGDVQLHPRARVGSLCGYFRRCGGMIALVLDDLVHRGCAERQLLLIGVECLLLKHTPFYRAWYWARAWLTAVIAFCTSTRIWFIWRCKSN